VSGSLKGRPEPPRGFLRQVDSFGRAAFPVAATAVLLVLAAAPVGVPGLVPAVALPCVFFWAVFRPAALPPPAVFGLGLLQDLLSFAPIGSGVLALLITFGFATRWRRFLARQSFLLVWLAFCGFAGAVGALGWGLQTLLGWRVPPIMPGLAEMGLTAGLYPIIAYLLTKVHEGTRRAEEAA
jgi:rod shape-determining protein MreD